MILFNTRGVYRVAVNARPVAACLLAAMCLLSGTARAEAPPLIAAVKDRDVAAFQQLLKAGSDVNVRDVDGSTPLLWGAYNNDVNAVELLVKAGADPTAANRYGVGALTLAASNGNAAILELLLRAGAAPDAAPPGGETPLMTAARGGHAEALKVLLANGAMVDVREGARGQTALMWASAQGYVEAIRALLEAGADVHARATGPASAAVDTPPDAEPPGAATAERPDSSTAGLLIFLGVRAPRMDRLTPIMFAARAGHREAVRVLIEAGADVNALAPDGTSVLELAIANAQYDTASLLLEKGADATVSGNGWTPLHRLARTRKPNLGYLPGIPSQSSSDSLALAEQLIAKGADVNARQTKAVDDSYRQTPRIGATPFWLAAKYVDVDLMRVLLEHGADPSLSTKNNTTPLMAAAGLDALYLSEDTGSPADTLAAVKLCVESGSDVTAVNDNGDTALHGAARRGVNAVVELLVAGGARLDARNKRDVTPFGVASGAFRGDVQPETAALLREAMVARGIEVEEIDPNATFDPLKRPARIRE